MSKNKVPTIPPLITSEFVIGKGNQAKSFVRSWDNHKDRLTDLESRNNGSFKIDDVINSTKRQKRKKNVTSTNKKRKQKMKKRKKINDVATINKNNKKKKKKNKRKPILQKEDMSMNDIFEYTRASINNVNKDKQKMIDEGEEDGNDVNILPPSLYKRPIIIENKDDKPIRPKRKRRLRIFGTENDIRERKIELINNEIINIKKRADHQELTSDMIAEDMVNYVKTIKMKSHSIRECDSMNMVTTRQNMSEVIKQMAYSDPIVMRNALSDQESRKMFAEQLENGLKHLMEQRRNIDLGENYKPSLGNLRMYDRRCLEQDINVYDDHHRIINMSMTKLYNIVCNSVAKSEGVGFSNEKHEEIKMLTVDQVEDGFRAPDPTLLYGGECTEFLCSNVFQSNEGDKRFWKDKEKNKCQAYRYSGGKVVFRSYPDPSDFNKICTFEKRRPCLLCRFCEDNRTFHNSDTNSTESTHMNQQYGVVINRTVGKDGSRSFKYDATLPEDKNFRGFTVPVLLVDTSIFIFDIQHTKTSDGKMWIAGIKIDSSAVF